MKQSKLKIKSLSYGAFGVGEDDDHKIVFVENSCPGDELEIQIYDDRKTFAFGETLKILQRSEFREESPQCPIHQSCGSCQWQHIQYQKQLEFKRNNLVELFSRSKLNIQAEFIPALIGMDNPWEYRNKVIYPVKNQGKKLIAGYYKRNSHDLIDVNQCPIQYSIFDTIIQSTKNLCQEAQINDQILRHILVRSNQDQNQILLALVVRERVLDKKTKDKLKQILKDIKLLYPVIKAIALNYNDLSTNVIIGNSTESIEGQDYIEEKFGDIKLQISTNSFFQINSIQFLKIITLIQESITKPSSKLLDAYCGIGTISLSLLSKYPELEVIGVEEVEDAISRAKLNLEINKLGSANFINAKTEDIIHEFKDIEYLVVNPPRKGCHQKALKAILQNKPRIIFYISCNPTTLVRDLEVLCEQKYQIKSIQGVDMFPHTYHIETLVILELL